MAHVLDATPDKPVPLFHLNANLDLVPVLALTEPVRVYPFTDPGTGIIMVRMLSGVGAGVTGFVFRDAVVADTDLYVADRTELDLLFGTIANETFIDSNNEVQGIPFQYPPEGCWARASVMGTLLTAAGYRVDWLFLIDYGGIVVDSIFGDDLTTKGRRSGVTWSYHVAPVIYVGSGAGPYVIDPSLLDRARSPAEWVGRMTQSLVKTMTYDEMVAALQTTHRYPVGPGERPWMVWAPTTVYPMPPAAQAPTVPAQVDLATTIAMLEKARVDLAQRLATGALNALTLTWSAVVGADGRLRTSANPYPDFQSDRQRAESFLLALTDWDRTAVRLLYGDLMDSIRKAFAGSGVESDITALLAIVYPPVTV